MQGTGNVSKIFYKLTIIIGQSHERADILDSSGHWILLDYFYFLRIWLYAVSGDHVTKVVNLFLAKVTLTWLEFQTSGAESVEDKAEML